MRKMQRGLGAACYSFGRGASQISWMVFVSCPNYKDYILTYYGPHKTLRVNEHHGYGRQRPCLHMLPIVQRPPHESIIASLIHTFRSNTNSPLRRSLAAAKETSPGELHHDKNEISSHGGTVTNLCSMPAKSKRIFKFEM